MTETVKELIVKIKQEIKLCNSALSLKTLEDLINKYEDKLAEKNEYIKFLENRPGNHDCKNCPNKQQLYKEDFDLTCYA